MRASKRLIMTALLATGLLYSAPVEAKHSIGCMNRNATIQGTHEADVIFGTAGNDVIAAQGGADTIWAGAGNDLICGNRNTDTVFGGSGNDRVSGGKARDTCEAEKKYRCED